MEPTLQLLTGENSPQASRTASPEFSLKTLGITSRAFKKPHKMQKRDWCSILLGVDGILR